MKKRKQPSGNHLPLLLFLLIASVALLGITLWQGSQRRSPTSLGLETASIVCRGTGTKVFTAKGQGELIKLSTAIYPMLGTVTRGGIVSVNVMAIGSGTVSVADSQGNTYELLVKQPLVTNSAATVYQFVSRVTSDLPVGSTITVTDTKAKSLGLAVIGCNAPTGLSVVGSSGTSGYTNLPLSPSLAVLEGDVVLSMLGVNAKSTTFGLGNSSGILLSGWECQNAGMQTGSDANATTIYVCFARASGTGTTILQQNIVDTKDYLTPGAAPKVGWAYAVSTIR